MRAPTVVIASGVAYRKLRVDPIEELVGLGVYYGAAMTAAREMEDQDVYVVGGGNSAGQAAVHLSRFAGSVTILVRRPDLAETMSSYLIGEIEYNARISTRTCTMVVDGGGDGPPRVALPRGRPDREADNGPGVRPVPAARCGAALRLAPAGGVPRRTRLRAHRARRPRDRWVDGLPPENLATTVPGIFAAGDVRSGSMKRVASASGEGASVVPLVHAHLAP